MLDRGRLLARCSVDGKHPAAERGRAPRDFAADVAEPDDADGLAADSLNWKSLTVCPGAIRQDRGCRGVRLAKRASARLGARRRSPLGSARDGVPAMECFGKAALVFSGAML